ncbi:MAG: COP9 signalosome catalytic subunit rri1 [Chaenotheca gracillima]|nr:MAG: COP9 signalosome catalytic subunit rri1 [Chaenotheca gracillima]
METALRSWEFDNAVELVDPQRDALYSYDGEEQKAIQNAHPWRKDPNYFKNVRISAVALLKMVMHARSGGSIEVMGLMQGKIIDDSFIVTDAFRLPVEGTETRVNAVDEANEYMVEYLRASREAGQMENAVGWYHSHPGYGCWLSGIDVGTQMTQQTFQDPFLAVVIDPDRTISAGKVEIGAFRTYPEEYKPAAERGDGYQTIPLAKIEDFGAHSSRYYSLEVSHFKSSLDTRLLELLWNKYWVSTLSQSPLFTNRDYTSKQMQDLSQKIRNAEQSVSSGPKMGTQGMSGRLGTGKDSQLDKVVKDSNKIAGEEITGLLAGVVKDRLFNGIETSRESAST